MARIVFELDVDAAAAEVLRALNSQAGIAGWWTDDVTFAGGAGSTMKLGFPIAPRPFELRVDEVTDNVARWTSVGEFPPHWADTTVTWTLRPADDGAGTMVHFSHDGWATDEGPFATAALTWAQLLLSLKRFAETGADTPLFHDN
jgi:uncharacterized protein YndB with AHSA1/START domain